jgi:membrane-bound lytic murein transglycosylase D
MISLNIFITFCALLIPCSFFAYFSRKYTYMAPQLILKLNYALIPSCSLLSLFVTWMPASPPSAGSAVMAPPFVATSVAPPVAGVSISEPIVQMIELRTLGAFLFEALPWTCYGFYILGILFVLRNNWLLRRYTKKSFLYRQIGTLQIYLRDHLNSPFAARTFLNKIVVLPTDSLMNSEWKSLYLKHELQHHRQGDTLFLIVLGFLQGCFFWHPFFWLWKKNIEQIQEISCDCFLIGHKKINPGIYINCLLQTQQKATTNLCAPAGVTLSFWQGKRHLLWRVKVMNDFKEKKKRSAWFPLGMIPVVLFALLGTAYASKSVHRVDLNEEFVREAIEAMSIGQSQIPVEKDVMLAIANIMNSKEKKKIFREALLRLKEHDSVIDDNIALYGIPKELKAMGLVESRFQNLPPQNNIFERSTGMWQIIGPTARVLGLTVNPQLDERRDVKKSTNAAMRYLAMNHARFDNWDLSVLSYNAGENAVAEAVKKAGSKDPIKVKAFLQTETQRYYTKVLAAAIILNNPTLIED